MAAHLRAELDLNLASRLADIALGHVKREYPSHLAHVWNGAEDAGSPRALHPVFYGSYDWHSCVHGHWMLARLLRCFPHMACAGDIVRHFDEHYTAARIAAECAYLERPLSRGFERPYGWAWLLALAAELALQRGRPWQAALQPLTGAIVQRFTDYLPLATYPVRSGTHTNTAFALRLAADHADASGNEAVLSLLVATARRWYGEDHDCPAWGEPGGDDFLSPALIEAECMRRLLPATEFTPWFERFLPRIAEGAPATLFMPAFASDRSDGKIAHLDGLNLSRAWCWRSLAGTWSTHDPRHVRAEAAADLHLQQSLPQVAGHYMGSHWLGSFAVLALQG